MLAAEAGVVLEFSAVDLATGLGDSARDGGVPGGEVLIVNTNTHLESLLDDSVLRSNPRDNFLKVGSLISFFFFFFSSFLLCVCETMRVT